MKLKIIEKDETQKEYTIQYDIEARLKLANEIDILEKIKMKDHKAIIFFVFCCLKKYKNSFENFLQLYPEDERVISTFGILIMEIIRISSNPYNLIIPKNEDVPIKIKKEVEQVLNIEERRAKEHKDLYETIVHLQSMGYKYKEILNMTFWEIDLLSRGDYLKFKKEARHTDFIINTIAGSAGYKGEPLSILGKRDNVANEEMQAAVALSDMLAKKRAEREKKQAQEIVEEVKKGVIVLCKE